MWLQKRFAITIKSPLKWRFILSMVAMLLIGSVQLASCAAASLNIVHQGKSTYTIVVPTLAAVSVADAATEMQRDIAEATGAKLPIQKDNETATGPFIRLGFTRQAKAANITTANLADDAFHTLTKNGDLFIIGIDTTTEVSQWKNQTPKTLTPHPEIPGPAYTSKGGFSNGTANGVYSFLENQLNVRWLFPGDLGRDVRSISTFTVAALDRTVTPAFNISGSVHTGENAIAVKVTKDRFAAGLYRGVAILAGVLPK